MYSLLLAASLGSHNQPRPPPPPYPSTPPCNTNTSQAAEVTAHTDRCDYQLNLAECEAYAQSLGESVLVTWLSTAYYPTACFSLLNLADGEKHYYFNQHTDHGG